MTEKKGFTNNFRKSLDFSGRDIWFAVFTNTSVIDCDVYHLSYEHGVPSESVVLDEFAFEHDWDIN